MRRAEGAGAAPVYGGGRERRAWWMTEEVLVRLLGVLVAEGEGEREAYQIYNTRRF